MSAPPPLLRTEGLTRRFDGLMAVDHVDFTLERGEIRALIGPNGAGKTTFVSMLSGRIAPSAGRIWFEGADITRLPAHRRARRGIAYTFQITSIYPALSVVENLSIAAQGALGGVFGGRKSAVGVAAREALARVGLLELAHAQAGAMSYGDQRLLELAMGLALRPRLLILDEPTQGLDEDGIARFCALIRELATTTTILLIEHNMDVVMRLATKITVLAEGATLAEGDPDAIRANPEVRRAYLGVGDA